MRIPTLVATACRASSPTTSACLTELGLTRILSIGLTERVCLTDLGLTRFLSIRLTGSRAGWARAHQEAVHDDSGSGSRPDWRLDVRLKDFRRPRRTSNSAPWGVDCPDDCIAQSHEALHSPAITCFGIKSAVSAIAVPYLVL